MRGDTEAAACGWLGKGLAASNRRPAGRQATTAHSPWTRCLESTPAEVVEIKRIMRAAERAKPRPWRDSAKWQGEWEVDSYAGFETWAAIRTRPNAELAAAPRRRESLPAMSQLLVTSIYT